VLADSAVGAVAVIAAVAAGVGVIVAELTLLLRSRADSRRADRHQQSQDSRE